VIPLESLASIAHWSADLTDEERARAARGISEKLFAGSYVCHLGDRLDCWVGV
jgi:CRP/FNR family cyclic AMP-dependent transcriptional regulator